MKAEEVLPITEELVFMYYQDGNDFSEDASNAQIHGFVFFYPSLNLCKVIEVTVSDSAAVADV